MKGLLYESFLLNRKWFLIAGIVAILGTLVCVILLSVSNPDLMGIANIVFIMSEFLTSVLCAEWLDRNLEKDLKCRFVDVTLAAGISKNMFVLSELVKNLLTIAIGFVMCLAMNGIVFAAEKIIGLEIPFWDVFYIKLALILALFVGIIDFVAFPLIINVKSAEKAGLIIGLVLGFGIVMPIMLIYFYLNPESGESHTFLEATYTFLDAPYFLPAVLGVAALIYALFYVITLNRVKRGDVC